MSTKKTYNPADSYLRTATACPEVIVGDIRANVHNISEIYNDAVRQHVSLVVFPELSLTGYTLGDLVQHTSILSSIEPALLQLARATSAAQTAMVVGLPFSVNNQLYNCAAVISGGKIRGIVPKTNLPNYKEFYERRWFGTWSGDNTVVHIGGQDVPFGARLLFGIGRATVGVEICEDVWVAEPPSVSLVKAGALVIANLSASPEQIGKAQYRRDLVVLQSARLVCGYVYAGCDSSESTTDIVMGGHQMVAENGILLAERPPFSQDQRLVVADIDLDHIKNDRQKDTNWNTQPQQSFAVISCDIRASQADLCRSVAPLPFVTDNPETLEMILAIQAQALVSRLENTGIKKVLLGLSGGLDSTLALLVAARAARVLRVAPGNLISTLTMPGTASSKQTQNNASLLASALAIPNEILSIQDLCLAELRLLGHDTRTQDITYENVQARMRTSLLFNRANQVSGLVLGTGDLSEIALGWSTFNGDHISHYNVNVSIPKTLIKHLVAFEARRASEKVRPVLEAILATPISPELTQRGNGISQETEKLIGPYELHDFFLYHFVRWNEPPQKIAYLAATAFSGNYTKAEIRKWLRVFLRRFISSQWKRSVAADGPKVGSVSLSPRGDWRAPSDMRTEFWQGKV